MYALKLDLSRHLGNTCPRHEPFGYQQGTLLECLKGYFLREHHVTGDQRPIRHKTPTHFETTAVIELVHIHGSAIVNTISSSGIASDHIEVPFRVELFALMWG
jgi:hypothetical protein